MAAPETDRELDALVATLAGEHVVPGVAVGVLHGEREVVACHGVTSTADPLEVTPDTLFLIGSTTKTMTGTVVMRLVDEGRLSLDDRVIDHVPELRLLDPAAREVVTVRQLLNHSAGWRGDAVCDVGWGDDALARSLDALVAEMPQLFPPGTMASYNNAAVLLAGRVVEKVTGTSYEDAVRTMLFEPLGMADSYFLPWEVASRRVAVGHLVADGRATPYYEWPFFRAMNPAGGAISSVLDQLRYARYHLDGTAALAAPLIEDSRLAMREPTSQMRSGVTGAGVTWLLKDRAGTQLVTHGGNVSGLHLSAFVLAPDDAFAVTVLTNSGGGAALHQHVVEWALDHYLGQPTPDALPVLPLSSDLAAEYVGSYDAGQWNLEVTHVEGRLLMAMVLHEATGRPDLSRPPSEVFLVGPDQLASAAVPTEVSADFVRDDIGTVRWLRAGMRLARKLEA